MPLIDMPLDRLRNYEGRNPRPADFDAYWERALQEMRATDAQWELVASNFQVPYADCYHLYFTGTGGARIHAKYVRPKHASGRILPCCIFTAIRIIRETGRISWVGRSLASRFLLWIAGAKEGYPKITAP